MAITQQKKINPYLRINTTIVQIMNDIGTAQAAIPGLTAETLATIAGDKSDDQFNNQYQRNEITKISAGGFAAVAVNQYDASLDILEFQTFAVQQIMTIAETSSYTNFSAYITSVERVAQSQNISADDARTVFIMCQIGNTIAKYWNDQKTLGAGSSWNNYLGGLTYSSGWTLAGLKGVLLYLENGASIEGAMVAGIVYTIAQVTGVTR